VTDVSLIVPVSGEPERERAWDWLRPSYEATGWEIVECPDTATEWSKGRAVNPGVAMSSGNRLIIADADLYIDLDVLGCALDLLGNGAAWVVPHKTVYRLAPRATRALRAMPEPPLPSPTISRHHLGPVGGGFVVCTRSAFDEVHGIDPRFTGWGGEDISFGWALDTLVGKHTRLDAPTWHMHHPPMQRFAGRASPENEWLAGRYADARGEPVAMRAICEEH